MSIFDSENIGLWGGYVSYSRYCCILSFFYFYSAPPPPPPPPPPSCSIQFHSRVFIVLNLWSRQTLRHNTRNQFNKYYSIDTAKAIPKKRLVVLCTKTGRSFLKRYKPFFLERGKSGGRIIMQITLTVGASKSKHMIF